MLQPNHSSATPTPLSWKAIKKSVLDYQAHLRGLSIDPQLKRKAFLLDKETIDRLLQLGSGTKAIRLYIGSEPDGSGLRIFPVACHQKTDHSGKTYYEDVNIPLVLPEEAQRSTGDTSLTAMETTEPLPDPYETRPCPSDCSTANFLNP